ncbi:RND family transporter [Nocardia sp. NPDC049149]|uniref:MMPL/RND family transporter n=1 Tax=Nocardia sp. NPDC049149 TaxID=3364315 RepID=UPI00371EF899
MTPTTRAPGRFAEFLRRYAVLVVVAWVGLAGLLNLVIPQVETVVARQAQPFLPTNAESAVALSTMGERFHESDTNNVSFVFLEADHVLGQRDRDYYNSLLRTLTADKDNVQSAMDLWSDPMTGVVNQSADGKAAYVMLRLAGYMGTVKANDAIGAVRHIVETSTKPPGLTVYVTGPGAAVSDELTAAERGMVALSVAAGVLIGLVLLVVYRSPLLAGVPLAGIGMALAVARPLIALVGELKLAPVSSFSVMLGSALILGAGADYAIFFIGRYHEGRRKGIAPAAAYHAAYRGIGPIVTASALTIAGACACMSLAQLSLFKSAGIPCAIAILVALAAAMTLVPALMSIGASVGLLEPRAVTEHNITRTWRRIGTRTVRWPGPILAAGLATLIVCGLLLPGMITGYDERGVQPADTPSNLGYAAAERHFPSNRLSPDFVLIEANHDLRNPADMLAIERVARKLADEPGIDLVQGITRPLGTLLPQTSLTYQAGYIGDRIAQNKSILTSRVNDLDALTTGIDTMMGAANALRGTLQRGIASLDSASTGAVQLQTGVTQLRDSVDQVTSTAQPLRQAVADNPNCAADPLCTATKTVLDKVDSSPIATMVQSIGPVSNGSDTMANALGGLSTTLPQALSSLDQLTGMLTQLRGIAAALTGTAGALVPQISDITDFLQALGRNFSGSDSGIFYMPPQAFSDSRFTRALSLLMSADGKSTRMLVYGSGESFGIPGMERAAAAKHLAEQALKGTTLDGSVVSVGGVGSSMKDVRALADHDFTLVAVVALAFVFLIILVVLRSLVAAALVIGTVLLAYATALGLGVLVWQHLLGIELHWMVAPLAFITLVAVGADYNLLLTARFKEEARAGLNTGIIRSLAGTGSVVTTAGVVFGLTMLSLLTSKLTNIAQVGSVVGIGLFVDTFLVRSFIIPAAAAKLATLMWWPIKPADLIMPRAERLRPHSNPAPTPPTLFRPIWGQPLLAAGASLLFPRRLFPRRALPAH